MGIVALVYWSGEVFGQNNKLELKINTEKLPFQPKEYYIQNVIDERGEKGPIAQVITNPNGQHNTQPADLKGGNRKALENYFYNALPQDRSLRPIVIKVRSCSVLEKRGQGNIIEGVVDLQLAFEWQKEEISVHLIDYNGGLRYKRSPGNLDLVEEVLGRALANSLEYFNNWIQKEADSNIKLAKGVKVFFREYDKVESGDTVFYAPSRPIQWEDFQAPTRPGKYVASIFTSFAWEGESEIVDGWLHLFLTTKVFMLKKSSWVKPGSKDAYGLNHERRHFDITKLVVERFKQKIRNRELSPLDYDGVIGYEYIQTYREMNRLQEAYDEATNNGRNRAAQEKWNAYIKEELAKDQKANESTP